MLIKLHQRNGKLLVSVCDSDLIAKYFEEDDKVLDLTSDFYKGEEKTAEETGDIIRNADYVNLVGEKSVEIGLKEGIIEKENVILIQGVPHAQAVINQE